MVAETILSQAGNYFLLPDGLLAISALLPLLIFYLIRKKPDEQIMPSYMFFQQQKKSGSSSQAFRTLLRNLILLFHILMVVMFASAIADPFIEQESQSKKSVLVLDRSASMEGDFEDGKEFLRDKIGESSTLILVDDSSRVAVEDSSERIVRQKLKGIEQVDTETDIVSGLEKALGYEGDVYVASDMTQSATEEEVSEVLDIYRSNQRSLEIMDTERRNSWGVTDLEVGRQETDAYVKNFLDREVEIDYSHNGEEETLEIDNKSLEIITFESEEGENRLELEGDDYPKDNTAYFYVPQEEEYKVALISDSGNRYLETVFELVNFTEVESYNPPVRENIEADIYVVGETERILSETVNSIESDVRDGSSIIVFGNNVGEIDLEFPVENRRGNSEEDVTVEEPVRINLGEMEINNLEKTSGESLGNPDHTLIRHEYGDGEMILYNLEDEVFRERFLYPVFWKEVSSSLVERRTVEASNIETGKEPQGSDEEILTQGFHRTENGKIAANLLSERESLRDDHDQNSVTNSKSSEKESLQMLFSLLILGLVCGEILYLYRLGDLE